MAGIFGYTTAQWRDNPKVHRDIIDRRREEFGIVGLASGLRLRTVAQALGANIFFPEVGIDRVVDPAIDNIKDLNKLMNIDPFTSPVYLAILERLRFLKDAFPEMGIGFMVTGPITIASTVLGADKVLRETVKHPDAVSELMDLANYHTLSWVKMFVEEFGSAGCNVCDPFTCAGILSRKQFVEISKPKLENLIAGLTDLLGRKPGLHICGKTSPLWDEIGTLQVANFSVDNCESLAEAKEHLGDKFALVGNVAPVDVMLLGTPEDVVEACKECIRQGAESPLGYNLGTGCQVPIGTPRENFEAFVYAARIYGAGAMMEDEVRTAWEKFGRGMRIMWVDRGYHEKPETLHAKLQEMIEMAEAAGATEVLLAIGLCGNGAVGLKCDRAKLVMPRFDDCVNLMLQSGTRTCRGLAQAGVMYLTRGWSHDATMVCGQREFYVRKYGERRADRLMKAMFGSYHAVSMIDTGCYEIDEIREYADACAHALGVEVRIDAGSNTVMEKLIAGRWDNDILVCEPGRAVMQEDFDKWDASETD